MKVFGQKSFGYSLLIAGLMLSVGLFAQNGYNTGNVVKWSISYLARAKDLHLFLPGISWTRQYYSENIIMRIITWYRKVVIIKIYDPALFKLLLR